ncbi:hypothetical protein [Sphingobacterium detergens]|uniref:hypothetical protein n=1 Tax=Sphingobacterium detergens TaxID=1145106 RepID=UPI003AAE791C
MNQNLSKELVNSIVSSNASQVYIDIGEALLDTKINDEIIKNIPILSTIYNLSKAVISISDKLFLKKVMSFLYELNSIDKNKIENFKLKMESDDKFQKKVGEKLIFIIDKCEDDEKSVIVGKIFKAYLNEKITYEDFLMLSKSIELLGIWDINEFKTNKYWDFSWSGNLIAAGLLSQELIRGDERYDSYEYKIDVRISGLGEKLKNIL